MKKLMLLCFFVFALGCKKNTGDVCVENCLNGFECDSVTEECVCPEGKYITSEGYCLPVNKETMYLPVEANSDCFCFYDITSFKINEAFNPPTIKFTHDYSYTLHYFFNEIPLSPNTVNPSEWAYRQTFVSGSSPLPCKYNGQFVNAHFYMNVNNDTIKIKADIVPYIEEDILHWGDYPVLGSCNLMFVKPK